MYVIMCKVSVRMLSMRSTLSKHSSKIEPATQKYEQSGCRCIFCLCVCVFFKYICTCNLEACFFSLIIFVQNIFSMRLYLKKLKYK